MGLRDRKKLGDEAIMTPPQNSVNGARRGGRGRTVTTPNVTPRPKVTGETTTPGRRSRAVTPAKGSIPVSHDPMPELKPEILDASLARAMQSMASVYLEARIDPARVPLPDSPARPPPLPKIIPHQPSPLKPQPHSSSRFAPSNSIPANPFATAPTDQDRFLGPRQEPTPSAQMGANGQPKIFLRFRTPSPTPEPNQAESTPSNLYPSLPGSSNAVRQAPHHPFQSRVEAVEGRAAYRETSVGTTSTESADGEYLSSDSRTTDASRSGREGSTGTTGSGPGMPGKFVR